MSAHTKQSGFTTIELLITLFVAFAFIAAFYRLFTVIDQSTTESRWQSTASSLAYTNLRKYTIRPSDFACNANTDLTAGSNRPGQVLLDETDSGSGDLGIPGEVTQTVRAFAPFGCGDAATLPVKIESRVTYGDNREAVHATYVN